MTADARRASTRPAAQPWRTESSRTRRASWRSTHVADPRGLTRQNLPVRGSRSRSSPSWLIQTGSPLSLACSRAIMSPARVSGVVSVVDIWISLSPVAPTWSPGRQPGDRSVPGLRFGFRRQNKDGDIGPAPSHLCPSPSTSSTRRPRRRAKRTVCDVPTESESRHDTNATTTDPAGADPTISADRFTPACGPSDQSAGHDRTGTRPGNISAHVVAMRSAPCAPPCQTARSASIGAHHRWSSVARIVGQSVHALLPHTISTGLLAASHIGHLLYAVCPTLKATDNTAETPGIGPPVRPTLHGGAEEFGRIEPVISQAVCQSQPRPCRHQS